MKVDLHTHSSASRDGGIKPEQYVQALEEGQFDAIAITDHNTIDLALSLQHSIGNHIIVGEEISTAEGELIGLFLTHAVMPGQSAAVTIRAIKEQGGIVYVPHPFETVRLGLSEATLNSIANDVDIVEVHNGRAVFQNRGPKAAMWARLNGKVMAASSDAHGAKGLGTTYTSLREIPTAKNIVELLATARFITKRPPLRSLFYPKIHRLNKRLSHK